MLVLGVVTALVAVVVTAFLWCCRDRYYKVSSRYTAGYDGAPM